MLGDPSVVELPSQSWKGPWSAIAAVAFARRSYSYQHVAEELRLITCVWIPFTRQLSPASKRQPIQELVGGKLFTTTRAVQAKLSQVAIGYFTLSSEMLGISTFRRKECAAVYAHHRAYSMHTFAPPSEAGRLENTLVQK